MTTCGRLSAVLGSYFPQTQLSFHYSNLMTWLQLASDLKYEAVKLHKEKISSFLHQIFSCICLE